MASHNSTSDKARKLVDRAIRECQARLLYLGYSKSRNTGSKDFGEIIKIVRYYVEQDFSSAGCWRLAAEIGILSKFLQKELPDFASNRDGRGIFSSLFTLRTPTIYGSDEEYYVVCDEDIGWDDILWKHTEGLLEMSSRLVSDDDLLDFLKQHPELLLPGLWSACIERLSKRN